MPHRKKFRVGSTMGDVRCVSLCLCAFLALEFTALLNYGGSNSPWSEFLSEFPHIMVRCKIHSLDLF